MTKKDYYQILGIDKTATIAEIKSAYKKLAKQYHPDINKEKGSEEKFKEISEAYAVLSDDKKRSMYDQFGHNGFDQRFSQEDIFRNFNFDIFEDIFGSNFGGGNGIFDMFFGGGRRRQRYKRGSDLRYDMEISLKEAHDGIAKNITIPKHVECPNCKGTGSEDGKLEDCPECKGSGQFAQTHRTPFGMIRQSTICRGCGGEGKIIKNPCDNCQGSGLKRKNVKLEVKIPSGVDTGNQLRLSEEGESVKGGSSGDLYVVIYVIPDDIFDRRGDDLYLAMPVSFAQATLGTKIKIPTIEGKKVEMKISTGTQSGTIFRIKGKGMPHLNRHGQGDLYVEVFLKTPNKLSAKQKKLFEQLAKEFNETLKPDKSFFDRIKDSFT